MLVQYHVPQFLSPSKLDRFLAGGWFRNCHLLFRSQIICLDSEVYTIMNIRLPLQDYRPPKRLRKIASRGNRQFRHEISHLSLDQEKELLFTKHSKRFKGFLFDSLEQFFSEELMGKQVFDTKEVRIYDGDRLVAYSFFDEGKESLASLLGVFDEEYAKYSLGTYSMLLEIEYARQSGKRYYYPGYTLDKPSVFDYKLRLGDMEYYNWRMARWEDRAPAGARNNPATQLLDKLEALSQHLSVAKVPHQRLLYPIFSLGYLSGFEDFVQSPVFLTCGDYKNRSIFTIMEYDMSEKLYTFSKVEVMEEMAEIAAMRATEDYSNQEVYITKPICHIKVLAREESPQELVSTVIVKMGIKSE